MNENYKSDVPVKIGGETYLLRFNFKALKHIESVTGKPAGHAVLDLVNGMISPLEPLLQGALKQNHPDLDEDAICDLIDAVEDTKQFGEAIGQAWLNYTSKGKPVTEQTTEGKGVKKKTPSPRKTDA